ncbi:MAG: hypothetical protein ACQCN6_15010 [Candidatus Bathyarchaeia archaeon]|jgi:uncharacterized C2H2 Zn-finger protein
MTQTNDNHYYKCPHCSCIFFSQADLQKHIAAFGTNREQHELAYKKTHGRLEHGYSDE